MSRWVSNLKDPAEIQEFQRMLNSNKNSAVLKRLYDIIVEDKTNANRAQLKSSNYDSPSWGYAQADSIGYQRALQNIELLLKGLFN